MDAIARARLGRVTRAISEWAPEGIAGLVAVAFALAMGGKTLVSGFPLDDAWIHLAYGRELRASATLAYNAGVPATGCTSPLWALVAAAAQAATGSLEPSLEAAMWLKSFGIVAFAVTAVLGAQIARECTKGRRARALAALSTGLLIASAPFLAYGATSGMETSLAGALLLGVFLLVIQRRFVAAGALVGLAVAARPEAFTAIFVVAAVVFFLAEPQRRARAVGRMMALASLPIAGIMVRNVVASGRPLYATFYAKADMGQSLLTALAVGFGSVLDGLIPRPALAVWALVALAIVLGAGTLAALERSRRPRARLTAARTLVPAAMGVTAVAFLCGSFVVVRVNDPHLFYYQRYALPAVPLLMTVAGAVAFRGGSWMRAKGRGRRASVGATAAAVLAMLAMVGGEIDAAGPIRAAYSNFVEITMDVQVAAGRFVRETVPEGAAVWTVDAGAVRYWGQRETVDLMGLNTPDLLRDRKVRKTAWPDAIVLVPAIFKIDAPPSLLSPVFLVHAAKDTTRPIERSPITQMVLRCNPAEADDRDNKIVIVVRGEPIAVGRCARH